VSPSVSTPSVTPPAAINIVGPALIRAGSNEYYYVRNVPSGSEIRWDVRNGTGRATIDSNGYLTAISEGTVTVYAQVGSIRSELSVYIYSDVPAPSATPPSPSAAPSPTQAPSPTLSASQTPYPSQTRSPNSSRDRDRDSGSSGSQATVNPPTEGYLDDLYQKPESKSIIDSQGSSPIIISGYKKGAIISGADVLTLVNNKQDVALKKDAFTFSITPELANEWKINKDSTIEIRVVHEPTALSKSEIERISKIDPVNAAALEKIYNVSVLIDGVAVKETTWPIKVTVDAAGLVLNNKSNVTGVYFDPVSKTYVRLGGEFSKDGKTFEFFTNDLGLHGLIVDSNLKKLSLNIGDKIAFKTENAATSALQNDVAPFISGENRTMIPLRLVAEALGAEVGWIESLATVTIKLNGKTIYLKLGESLPNGMGTPTLSESRTFVPVRYVVESFNAHVVWDPNVKNVKIYY
jgi:hypothetical protein